MGNDRAEFLLGTGHLQVFDDLVAQLRELDCNAARVQRARQRAQYRCRGDVDAGNERTIEHDGDGPGWRTVEQIDDLTADVLGVEVEPGAGVAHHEYAGEINRVRIAGAVEETSCGGIASED